LQAAIDILEEEAAKWMYDLEARAGEHIMPSSDLEEVEQGASQYDEQVEWSDDTPPEEAPQIS
jgi:hypothetical protein